MIRFYRNFRDPKINKARKSPKYTCRDAKCLGRECFYPDARVLPSRRMAQDGLFGQRIRWKQRTIYICTIMYEFGCPEAESYDRDREQERINDGWESTVL